MMLSGERIRQAVACGDIVIDPYDPRRINPNSYNLSLAPTLVVYDINPRQMAWHEIGGPCELAEWADVLDMKREHPILQLEIPDTGLVLLPGRLYLGRTAEWIGSPVHVPIVEGRSSTGRLGISWHSTAGFCDRGFMGAVTLEISVVMPVRVYADVQVAQVAFHEVDQLGPVYTGKYQNDRNALPMPCQMWKEFLNKEKI